MDLRAQQRTCMAEIVRGMKNGDVTIVASALVDIAVAHVHLPDDFLSQVKRWIDAEVSRNRQQAAVSIDVSNFFDTDRDRLADDLRSMVKKGYGKVSIEELEGALRQPSQVSMWRNIAYGTESKRHTDIFRGTVDQTVVGRMNFGSVFAVVEEKERHVADGKQTWVRVHNTGGAHDGWMLAQEEISGKITKSLIRLADWRDHIGRIPDFAFVGQKYPHEGMYTEGYTGAQDICVVSASGDNMWREINIEMLFRNISTATVFEKQWGGDANFTDWVAYYSFNAATHGHLGSGAPRQLVVTVKNTRNYDTYPRLGPHPDDVQEDIGKAQFKECEFLLNLFRSKCLPWQVKFMTTFQFLREYCKWAREDCRRAAESKARRIWEGAECTVPFTDLSWIRQGYIKDMVYWCLAEAFGGEQFAQANEHWIQMERHCKSHEESFDRFCEECGFTVAQDDGPLAAKLEARDSWGNTPVLKAVHTGNVHWLPKLKYLGASLNAEDWEGRTPMVLAAATGHHSCIKVLKELGASVNAQDKVGKTPMAWAASHGREACIRMLEDLGAEVEIQDEDGKTPIAWAAHGGHGNCILVLAELGSNVDAQENDGKTPMAWAATRGHEKCIQVLKELGASVDARSEFGMTPIFWAARNGHEQCIRVLQKLGAGVEVQDEDGQSPMIWAAHSGHAKCIQVLYDLGASVDAPDREGKTPMIFAARSGQEKCIRVLRDLGASVYTKDKVGQTPMAWAIHSGHEDCIQVLKDFGASVDVERYVRRSSSPTRFGLEDDPLSGRKNTRESLESNGYVRRMRSSQSVDALPRFESTIFG